MVAPFKNSQNHHSVGRLFIFLETLLTLLVRNIFIVLIYL